MVGTKENILQFSSSQEKKMQMQNQYFSKYLHEHIYLRIYIYMYIYFINIILIQEWVW